MSKDWKYYKGKKEIYNEWKKRVNERKRNRRSIDKNESGERIKE